MPIKVPRPRTQSLDAARRFKEREAQVKLDELRAVELHLRAEDKRLVAEHTRAKDERQAREAEAAVTEARREETEGQQRLAAEDVVAALAHEQRVQAQAGEKVAELLASGFVYADDAFENRFKELLMLKMLDGELGTAALFTNEQEREFRSMFTEGLGGDTTARKVGLSAEEKLKLQEREAAVGTGV